MHVKSLHRQRLLSNQLFVYGLRPHPQQVCLYMQKNSRFYASNALLPHRFRLKFVQSDKTTEIARWKLRAQFGCELLAIYYVPVTNSCLLYPNFPPVHSLLKDAKIDPTQRNR